MTPSESVRRSRAAFGAVLFLLFCSLSVRSEEKDDRSQELQVTVQALRQQNLNLQRKLNEALMKIEVLNMKASKGSAYAQKRSGFDKNLPGTPEELRWQLLTTLRLLRREELVREELEGRLRKVTLLGTEAIRSAEKVDPRKRASFEEEVRAAGKLLGPIRIGPDGEEEESAADLDTEALGKARVVEVRKDLSLVVLNVGREHGIRLGMPFDVVREGRLVAVVVVVELRDRICGALIERMEEKNPVQAEDLVILKTS